MDHDTLRHLADSWGLLFLLLIFLGAVGFAFRPGSRPQQEDARMIPLRDEDPQ